MRRGTWLNGLVIVALAMVVAWAALGWNWLPVVFPALGVLVAAGGAWAAATMDRAGAARTYLLRSLPRVLVPFWIAAAVLVPLQASVGWPSDADLGSAPLTWGTGWRWLLPLADPPLSTPGLEWASGLWLVRIVLWLVLLTPPLLWLFRRWPVRMAAVPVAALLLITAGLTGLDGLAHDQVLGLCTWSCCWLIGFAWYDGTLQRTPLLPVLAGAAALTGLGLWLAVDLQRRPDGDVYDSPVATFLFSAGAVLLLLRIGSGLSSGGGRLGFLPRRAVTVYLAVPAAVAIAPALLARTPIAGLDVAGTQGALVEYATAWVLLLLVALLPGTLEALIVSGRRPRARRYVLRDNVVAENAWEAAG